MSDLPALHTAIAAFLAILRTVRLSAFHVSAVSMWQDDTNAGFFRSGAYRTSAFKRVEFKARDRANAHRSPDHTGGILVNSIVYIVGLVVIVLVVLSFFGLR